jgi:hypothetical protein
MIARRAKRFAAGVRKIPIDIYPDELLVGFASNRQRGDNAIPGLGVVHKDGQPDLLGYDKEQWP